MWFVHHFLRPLWNVPLSLIYLFFYWLYTVVDSQAKETYKQNKSTFDKIKTMDELIYYVRRIYTYKWDGPKGLLDHHNYPHEFFSEGGDCDDVASYVHQKVKEFEGYKPTIIGLSSNQKGSWHYDCIIKDTTINKYYLFNYGKIISGNSIKECIDNISWDLFPVGKTTWWKCIW